MLLRFKQFAHLKEAVYHVSPVFQYSLKFHSSMVANQPETTLTMLMFIVFTSACHKRIERLYWSIIHSRL